MRHSFFSCEVTKTDSVFVAEYHLLIYSKSPYSLLQTLTYTTYSSSSLGSTLQSQWTSTPDSRYLQPMHDGSLMCFVAGVPGLQWTIGFDVPVVAVFDIATPPNPSSVENSQPIMLEQPHPLPVDGLPIAFDELQELPETTFIGKIGDDLFAMSRGNFPLVAFAPLNFVEEMDRVDGEEEEEDSVPVVSNCVGNACLVGSHRVQKSVIPPPSIEPPPIRLGIEAPSSTPSTGLSSTTMLPSPAAPNRSATILAAIYEPVKSLSGDTQLSALGFGLLGIAGWLWGKKLWRGKPNATIESTTPSLPLSPPRLTTPTLSYNASVALPPPILRDIVKDLPPLPIILLEDDGEGDSDKEDTLGDTPKRKSRRRRGKKSKKGKEVVLFPEPVSLEAELENLVLVEVEDDMEVDVVDPSLIGGLSVSETILGHSFVSFRQVTELTLEMVGYGSHGTVVLRGEFQGRAVAVKRLLKDFVTIATHEVALLQESDDHPNVIRYFCKEQRDTFLYIALELCPASLYELIDQPQSFPELSRDLDPKKALRQITGGIRHLHKLKIVHRDIKPQNILVAPAKLGGVRMLISDFGLCKKLDLDESSFQQTVNHAAGSFGYRAPEVLRGQVDPNAGASGTPSNSTAGSTAGDGTSTDPSMRLTRSIDIFSLGCIFYYVLTGGEHPFGGRYEREMNILRGKVSLERLDGLGEEALEVQDAITRMVANDPRERSVSLPPAHCQRLMIVIRPTAESVLLHPFFWNAQKRLLFICDASDRFEIMEREPPTATLVSLEDTSELVVGEDWSKSIDRSLLDNLGKYRKYDGKSVRDLLRVLRNKVSRSLHCQRHPLTYRDRNIITKIFPTTFVGIWAIYPVDFSPTSRRGIPDYYCMCTMSSRYISATRRCLLRLFRFRMMIRNCILGLELFVRYYCNALVFCHISSSSSGTGILDLRIAKLRRTECNAHAPYDY